MFLFPAEVNLPAFSFTFIGMSSIWKSPFKIAIIVIIIVGVIYGISVYTRHHETKDLATPTPKETPLNGDGNIK